MFTLADGIHLEDSKAILRWGCSRQEVQGIGHPTVAGARIEWRDKIFDGHLCTIALDLADDAVFDEVTVWFRRDPSFHADYDALFLYCNLFDYFLQSIGLPSIEPAGEFENAPILTWQHDGCLLRLSTWDAGREGITDVKISKK